MDPLQGASNDNVSDAAHGGIAGFLVKGPLGGNGNGFFDMGWILFGRLPEVFWHVNICQSVEWSHLEGVPFGRGAIWMPKALLQ